VPSAEDQAVGEQVALLRARRMHRLQMAGDSAAEVPPGRFPVAAQRGRLTIGEVLRHGRYGDRQNACRR
jgi:hypothetical protein